MLEKVLDQLLLRFLAPYLEGLSREKLRLGVFSGLVELKDLRVKREAPEALNFQTLRVKTDSVRLLRLCVPWKRLYSGMVVVFVEGLHFEVEELVGDGADAGRGADGHRRARGAAAEPRQAAARQGGGAGQAAGKKQSKGLTPASAPSSLARS